MKRAGRGRGGRGGGKPINMNLITTYNTINQQEKKQKVEAKTNSDTWENMSEIQQDDIYKKHYSTLEKDLTTMMDEDSQENQDNNKINDQSIGTLEDASYVTTTNMHNDEIG